MDWQAIAAIITGLGVIASFITTWWALRHDRQIARKQAERSEAAARLSESYTQRMVDALEAIAHERLPGVMPVQTGARWSLTFQKGDTFLLKNIGDAPAYNVTVAGHESLVGPNVTSGGPHLQPGEALTFMAASSLATSDTTITIEWTDTTEQDADRRTWRYPLPMPTSQ